MVWQWFLIVTVFVFMYKKIRNLKTSVRQLRSRLAFLYSDQEQRTKAHIKEIEAERSLTRAVIDMAACIEEMDRLEVEDLLAEIDEGNFN